MLIYFLLFYFLWVLVKWINLVKIIPVLSASAGPATHTVRYKELDVRHNLCLWLPLRLPGLTNHNHIPFLTKMECRKLLDPAAAAGSTNCLTLVHFFTTIFQHISEGFGGFSEDRDCVMFNTLMTGSIVSVAKTSLWITCRHQLD